MGQIFKRIKDISKSYINDDDSNFSGDVNLSDPTDAELKRVIEELNRGADQKAGKQQTNSGKREEMRMDLVSACRILQINSNATIDEIKTAYKNRIKEYHPDKVANLGNEIKVLAEKKTQEINRAYEFLKKEKNF
jgi:DnaJ-domain-containing protein 1